MMRNVCLGLMMLACFQTVTVAQKPTRDQKVRLDKKKVEQTGFWIYNDLAKAYEIAKQSNKPIVVALRCIPCEECVKLDDELVDTDPVIRPLLEQFVCVRVVGTNGLDLDTFQYDTDQSFAVFMLNADKTIYGRFGTRSHHTDWSDDVSLSGMARALEAALALHKSYPANAESLAGKRGAPLEFASPEKYPSLKDKYTGKLDYEGDVVKSCIHCHQIGDAQRDYYWSQSKPIPQRLMFPYPHPTSIGLVLDPTQCATVKSIATDSAASKADLQVGDRISHINGQPIVSIADVQWILHHVSETGGSIELTVSRMAREFQTQITLESGWRRVDDNSWRVASWPLRRIATGGMKLVDLTKQERESQNITGAMALKVLSVGQYGAHATAKKAGFLQDDIILEFDDQENFDRESDLFAYVNEHRAPGDTVNVKILRNGKIQTLKLPIQL